MQNEPHIPSGHMWPIIVSNTSEMFSIHELNFQQSAIDSLSPVQENIIISALITSLLVGSYFVTSIYHYMFSNYKDKNFTPIDILILATTITQHLTCFLVIGLLVVGISFDITYSDYVGEFACEVLWYSVMYCGTYKTFGSLGIAVYRVLLLKATYWIRRFDQRRVAAVLLVSSVGITTALTIGLGTGNGPASRKRVLWNWCKGKNKDVRQVLENYALIGETISEESELLAKMTVWGTLLGTIAELCCYLVIFSHLYSHDKGLFGRKVLKETEFLRRRQKNCMSFMVQFYGFIVECFILIGYGLGMNQDSDITIRVVITFSYWMEFGINAVVQVTLSDTLKEHLPHNRYFR